MRIESFKYQIGLYGLALLALGLTPTAPAQTFTQAITYTPTGGVNFYDTIEAFIVGDPADAFANPGLSGFTDSVPSSWRGGLRDRRQAIAEGIAPGNTTPTPLSFNLNFEGAQRPMVVDLVVWDGGKKKGTLVDTLRLTLDGVGGFESAAVPEGQISWAGVPVKWVKRANISLPTSGKANPYGGSVNVKNLSFKISKVTVELKGLTHTQPGDLEFLLVGPGGQKVLLMSDAGGSTACNNVNLTFDDSATKVLSTSPLVSGTFKPTVVGTRSAFPSPAPVGPYSTTLSAFNGTVANGAWSLYALDDLANTSSGNVKFGWNLTIQ